MHLLEGTKPRTHVRAGLRDIDPSLATARGGQVHRMQLALPKLV